MNNNDIIPSSVLHWNYRGFTEFPIQTIKGEESAITDIYLKENLLTRLPADISKLRNLESLYISGNDITELPVEISLLKCLKCLDCSGNRLRSIPDEVGEMVSLKFLILDENGLRVLPRRISDLRALRYLSVCDNKLQWLPQRPVFNYHHCEFRFWRNPDLMTIPYSLWFHMFRGQQTRSLNIGCLSTNAIKVLPKRGTYCRLKITQGLEETQLDIRPQCENILENSPPSLLELAKRVFYKIICDTAKSLTIIPSSMYSYNPCYYEENNNIDTDLSKILYCTNGNNKNWKTNTDKVKRKSYYAPNDVLEEYFSFLPYFMKRELASGPISRCENVDCRNAVFDFGLYEFCFGKLILIDNTEDVILSTVFCSKSCASQWKRGKSNLIQWNLVNL